MLTVAAGQAKFASEGSNAQRCRMEGKVVFGTPSGGRKSGRKGRQKRRSKQVINRIDRGMTKAWIFRRDRSFVWWECAWEPGG